MNMHQALTSCARNVVLDHADEEKRDARVKTLLWRDEFEGLRRIQKSPDNTSPKWDLGDLTSAAVALILQMPDAGRRLREQAAHSFAERMNFDVKRTT